MKEVSITYPVNLQTYFLNFKMNFFLTQDYINKKLYLKNTLKLIVFVLDVAKIAVKEVQGVFGFVNHKLKMIELKFKAPPEFNVITVLLLMVILA